MKLIYVTGNLNKFNHAKVYWAKLGIDLEQRKLEIDEIQSDSISEIAKDKAQKAFNIIKQPLIVSDSGWFIPALNNFPGPFMKYLNQWFSTEDFLALMKDKSDRTILFVHVVAVADKRGVKVFEQKIEGTILEKPDGVGLPSDQLIVLESNKQTIAKDNENNVQSFNDSNLWAKVAGWLNEIDMVQG